MLFSLIDAPAIFFHPMNDVLHEYLDDFVVVDLNDVVFYSASLKDHICHLKKVMARLREHQLFLRLEKCEFGQRSIKILGHLISEGEV